MHPVARELLMHHTTHVTSPFPLSAAPTMPLLISSTSFSRHSSSARLSRLVVFALGLMGCSAAPSSSGSGAAPLGAQDVNPPPVVVLVVVDQLRADLLDRYDQVFTAGFRRLRDQGYRFTQATHDHALTLTAPGHATVVTGTSPSKHGVVDNAWVYDGPDGRRMVENVIDPAYPLLEDPSFVGASPEVLERSGIGEWLQAARPGAKVLTASAKPRSSVLMAGRSDATPIWFEEGLQRFVTSTWYMDDYPEWLDTFNEDVVPALAGSGVWELEVPEQFRSLARPDSADYEGDGIHTTFPHTFEEASATWGDDFWGWWAATPRLDRATRLVAQAGIEGMGIGEDDITDLVAVSFSQTDRIGHSYGPLSLEQLDNLYRLDREIGAFLEWLDRRFGADGYLLALTADHGMANIPEYTASLGLPGLRLTTDSALVLQNDLNVIAAGIDPARPQDLTPALVAGVTRISWIEQAWSFTDLLGNNAPADSFTVLQRRSTFPGRRTGILGGQGMEMRFSPNTLTWSYARGSTHGSPYLYDRHVPFILFGKGVTAGIDGQPVSTTDIAPTLAEMLGIAAPDDLDGVSRRIR